MWSKMLFYMMTNPPGIVLSLLPAPQQAILAMDMEKSFAALYNPDGKKLVKEPASLEKTDDEEEENEETDVDEEEAVDDEEDEDEYDDYESEDDE
jgi:hypothetical protein